MSKFFIFYDDSITAKNPLYYVESELQRYAQLHTSFFLKRYHAGKGNHYSENEIHNTTLGIVGQKIFELLLQKLEIPYVPNDPVIDQRLSKDYDFKIPFLGKIEVKTYDYNRKKVLVKPSEWHGNDYLIVIQATTENAEKFKMAGWLEGKTVNDTSITRKAESRFNPYADAKILDIASLNPPRTFMEKLEAVYKQIW